MSELLKLSRRTLFSTAVVASVASSGLAQDKNGKADREALEKAFSERMSGAILVGHYSVIGKEMKAANPERYELKKVSKVQDDLWQFESRVKYGQTDVTLPLVLRMVWADDTPMISLTNVTLPGLGEGFSARVIFHGDRYAGSWQHGKIGGHLWGIIEKPDAK